MSDYVKVEYSWYGDSYEVKVNGKEVARGEDAKEIIENALGQKEVDDE